MSNNGRGLIDSFGRRIDYVRLSVTDRCDLRCRYCMAEEMQFLPHRSLLTVDEIAALADLLVRRGVRRIRLTGGEPLVRREIGAIAAQLGAHVGDGLEELTLTTNGTQLPRFATDLFAAGIRRINVSLDSRDPERFRTVTRRGNVSRVLAGIEAAKGAGLKIKINMVALAGVNDGEIEPMLEWCAAQGHDLTLIETMPMGEVADRRWERYQPLDVVRDSLKHSFGLVPTTARTGGPARYFEVAGTSIKLGMITPLSGNFCTGCNRIRITATGTVYGCLGRDQKVELREALREGGAGAVDALLDRLIADKPQGHDFDIRRSKPAVARHMSVTGG